MNEINDTYRIDYISALLEHCPHAEITHNDDKDEGFVGWTITVEGCEKSITQAATFRGCIDREILKAKGENWSQDLRVAESPESETPETDAFMTLIDDSEIDLGMVEAKLGDFERRNRSNERSIGQLVNENTALLRSSWIWEAKVCAMDKGWSAKGIETTDWDGMWESYNEMGYTPKQAIDEEMDSLQGE